IAFKLILFFWFGALLLTGSFRAVLSTAHLPRYLLSLDLSTPFLKKFSQFPVALYLQAFSGLNYFVRDE
ncbi:MAG: hypothetical protein AB4290_02565, partial [Spirulina sp.]